MDQIRPISTKVGQIGPKWNELDWSGQNRTDVDQIQKFKEIVLYKKKNNNNKNSKRLMTWVLTKSIFR